MGRLISASASVLILLLAVTSGSQLTVAKSETQSSRPMEAASFTPESDVQSWLSAFSEFRSADTSSDELAQGQRRNQTCADHDSAELVVGIEDPKPENDQRLASLVSRYCGKIVDTVTFGDKKAVVADIPFSGISSFVSEVENEDLARYVEPNVMFEADLVPNDPDWSKQWGLRRVEADYAWNTTTGGEIIVAVVDTGIDYTHPDLQPNYIALGFNWVKNNTDPKDDAGHGTHCAGIIGAVLNNHQGIAGVSQVLIMAEKFLDRYGRGSASKAAQAVIHAVDQGARIISCSFGGDNEAPVFQEAVQYAWDNGALIIAAAGNDGWDKPHYPSAYPEIISVAATDQTDACAVWSNWGETIEVAAPGVEIYSTTPTYPVTMAIDENYDNASGTSMACPHVSGIAALIWSQFPSYTNQEVRTQLRQTAQDLGEPGFDFHYGYGRVNTRRAVEGLQDHDLYVYSFEAPRALQPSEIGVISTTVVNFGRYSEANVTVECYANGTRFDAATISSISELGGLAAANITWRAPSLEGVYEIAVYVVPVTGETITWNNEVSKIVIVRTPRTFRVPQDYPTIKEAVKATLSGWGDTILVAPGTYYECFSIKSDYLTIIGENPQTTIIDANYSTNIIYPDVPYNTVIFDVPAVQVEADYVSISNLTICRGTIGMRLFKARGCRLRNVTFTDNIHTFGLTHYKLEDNTLYYYCHNIDTSNTIDGKPIYYWINEHNRRAPEDAGFFAAVACTNITMKNMAMANNIQGALFAFSHDITIENVTFETNEVGITVPNSRRVLITENTIKNSSSMGIWLTETDDTTITNNRIDNNFGLHRITFGIHLILSNRVFVVNNTVRLFNSFPQGRQGYGYTGTGGGVWGKASDDCIIKHNEFIGTGGNMLDPAYDPNVWEEGIRMWGARGNVVEENVLTNLSVRGIAIDEVHWIGGEPGEWGFSNNVIRRNNLTNVICVHPQYPWIVVGTGLEGRLTENNTFCENTIINSHMAFNLRVSEDVQALNRFYHNNFLDIHGWNAPPWIFPWSDGYPSGGNYWSLHTGADLYSGPHQNESGKDGIVDLPYIMSCIIDENEVNVTIDNYPLSNPWTPPDVAITEVAPSATIGVEGFVTAVNVTVENRRAKTESINIILYADKDHTVNGDEITIGEHSIPYLSGTSATISFEWNTTNISKGDYTIAAEANVEGEMDMADNRASAENTVTVLTKEHDIAIKTFNPLKTVVGQDSLTSITITVKNYGSFTETFNVTLCVNTTTVSSFVDVTLESGDFITLAHVWNTAGLAMGNYDITTSATTVANETVVADNTCSQLMCITILGDVDANFEVNIYDIVIMANAYGTREGDTRFLANCDLDGDQDIDIYDIVIASGNYGKSCHP